MRRSLLPLALLAVAPALAQPLAIAPPTPEAEAEFGSAVAGVPDADGDGGGDFLVGEVPLGISNINRAHLFSGTTGALLFTLESPNPKYVGQFGESVSGVEDLDGDGRGDLLIGTGREGRAYVFSGATGDLLHTLEAPDPNDLDFGADVAGVEDADGDGRGDLLVGAETTKRAYLFSGATGDLLHTLTGPSGTPGGFGSSVSGVPDASGDGRGDLLVGARWEGRAHLYSGATGQLLHTFEVTTGSVYGVAVAGVGDVDGDGRGDLLVGAPNVNLVIEGTTYVDAGQAYVFSGRTGALLRALESPSPEQLGLFGQSVSGVPDVDGDGVDDLGTGTSRERRAYVFSGRTGHRLFTLRSPNDEQAGGFGLAVAGIGDVNGDGKGDGVVGAPYEDAGAFNAGRVYLYRTGGADGAWAGAEDVAIVADPTTEEPAALALSAAPNPLSSGTTIHVALPRPAEVRLEAFDALGRRVAVLHEGSLGAGTHDVRWAPEAGLPGGMYLLRLRVEGEPAQTLRVTLAR